MTCVSLIRATGALNGSRAFTGSNTSPIRAILAFADFGALVSSAGLLRFRSLLLSLAACSFVARFTRASSSSSKLMTFAFPSNVI